MPFCLFKHLHGICPVAGADLNSPHAAEHLSCFQLFADSFKNYFFFNEMIGGWFFKPFIFFSFFTMKNYIYTVENGKNIYNKNCP